MPRSRQCGCASRGSSALLDKYGKETVLACMEEMMNRTERAVRSTIEKIPDGTYYGEAATDDDGTELDVPVWVRVEVTVKGDSLHFDFSKSDKQRKGFVNSIYNSTYANALFGTFMFMDPDLGEFHNEGSIRPITVEAPPGLVVSAQYPATVGASPVSVGSQTLQAVMSAMSKAMPERAITSWGMRNGHYIFGTDPRSRERYVTTTFDMDGGTGAVSGFDGHEGPCGMGSLGTVNKGNVEELEMRFPWNYKRWEFVADSGGAGRWRGGSGMHWEVQNEGGEAGVATGSSDGEVVRGPGALGGEPTRNNRSFLIRDGDESVVRGHRLYQLKTGDTLLKLTGGGAGVGKPAERDPQDVLWDVLNEYVSVEKAREIYKVAIDPVARRVLEDETRSLRSL